MNEKLAEALGHVDEKYVTAAAARRKKKKRVFLAVIAAVLALVMLTNTPTIPFVITAKAVALASDSRMPERPIRNGLISDEKFDAMFDEWYSANELHSKASYSAMADMRSFFQAASENLLAGKENKVWSPINAAIALAVLAETASGTTRQELLDVLGVTDIETLRGYITGIWEMCYEKDGHEISALANSLWLDNGMKYDQNVMDTLAYDYYASVYQGDLGSGMTNSAMQNWVNNQTGGFLRQQAGSIDVSPTAPAIDTVLALVSTVYVQSKWVKEFDAGMNTEAVFHAPDGDTGATFMNMEEETLEYHWSESYGAVRLPLENETQMWLILPDADKTVADVLAEGEYLGIFLPEGENENSQYVGVNLSVPQFDISSNLDLKEGLEALGVNEVFDENGGDFGETFETDLPIFVNRVNQATRVSIDEEGVTAASYIVLEWGAGAAGPSEKIIDFILDRPFLFAITSYEGIPMFLGVVNEP